MKHRCRRCFRFEHCPARQAPLYLGFAQDLGHIVRVACRDGEVEQELAPPAAQSMEKAGRAQWHHHDMAPKQQQPTPYLYIPSSGLMLISKCISLSFPSGKLMVMLGGRDNSAKSAHPHPHPQGAGLMVR